MKSGFIDEINKILIYDGNTVYIAFKNDSTEPYFYAKQVCALLEYKNTRDSIINNVSPKNRFKIRDIVVNYKLLYKNIQGHTIFINEVGLYELINNSRSKNAKKIKDWVANEVLPALRKKGEFRLKESEQIQRNELNKKLEQMKEELNKRDKEIGVLKHNLKQPKIKKGNVVYIIREIIDDVNMSQQEILKFKIGKSKDLKKKKINFRLCTSK